MFSRRSILKEKNETERNIDHTHRQVLETCKHAGKKHLFLMIEKSSGNLHYLHLMCCFVYFFFCKHFYCRRLCL